MAGSPWPFPTTCPGGATGAAPSAQPAQRGQRILAGCPLRDRQRETDTTSSRSSQASGRAGTPQIDSGSPEGAA